MHLFRSHIGKTLHDPLMTDVKEGQDAVHPQADRTTASSQGQSDQTFLIFTTERGLCRDCKASNKLGLSGFPNAILGPFGVFRE